MEIYDKVNFQHNIEALKPLLLAHFDFTAEGGPQPTNYAQLRSDNTFRQTLWMAKIIEESATSTDESIRKKGEKLNEELGVEIS